MIFRPWFAFRLWLLQMRGASLLLFVGLLLLNLSFNIIFFFFSVLNYCLLFLFFLFLFCFYDIFVLIFIIFTRILFPLFILFLLARNRDGFWLFFIVPSLIFFSLLWAFLKNFARILSWPAFLFNHFLVNQGFFVPFLFNLHWNMLGLFAWTVYFNFNLHLSLGFVLLKYRILDSFRSCLYNLKDLSLLVLHYLLNLTASLFIDNQLKG